jgi:DNA-binding SARP family transcriptional activator
MVAGDFLDGLEVERSALFSGWLTAQRRQFRGAHAALLEHLATTLPDAQALPYIETWLQLAPFDLHAHQRLLNALAQLGRIQDGERHLASAVTQLEAEGLSAARLPQAWQAHARRRGAVGASVGAR